MKFRVSPHCSVMLNDPKGQHGRRLLRAGQELPDNLTKQQINELLGSRHIFPVGSSVEIDRKTKDLTPPGVQPPLPVPSDNDLTKPSPRDRIIITQPGDVQTRVSPKPVVAAKSQKSPWVLDPTLLKGKSLDDLNVMLLERDDQAEVFDTPEEAIAFLSQDFASKP